ncbi:MAG: hypothetical protein ACKOA1_04950 [Bacteroidota bacterium]
MNNRKRLTVIPAILVFLTLFGQVLLPGCKKDGPTKAVITVNDSLGRPAPGTTVTLFQDTVVNQVTGAVANVRQTKTTDAAGKAEFEFTLEAFLNLQAYRGADTVAGFVRLELHKTVYQTVTL